MRWIHSLVQLNCNGLYWRSVCLFVAVGTFVFVNDSSLYAEADEGEIVHIIENDCEPCSDRLIILGIASGVGGIFTRSSKWARADASLEVFLGIQTHEKVIVQLGFINSLERLFHGIRAGIVAFLYRQILYSRFSVDVWLGGVGVQPGLSGAVGVSWRFPFHFGIFAEFEALGRLINPYALELNGVVGIITYF